MIKLINRIVVILYLVFLSTYNVIASENGVVLEVNKNKANIGLTVRHSLLQYKKGRLDSAGGVESKRINLIFD